ncbi:hypothetical protein F8G81_07590 [Arthrobacter sp. CDRTa11]|uniref:hypothetical protein n=1 Tax=Arthrobacter sp. CDRTa11 TaxID=2651199 RepID=UPI00226595F5|nr:hypothetical protein [Arthrobacter sp. CDRTa11]UZX02495.1 hypothetical protein F8G81_07590 [Arthrobacter sp. CDRTa11]
MDNQTAVEGKSLLLRTEVFLLWGGRHTKTDLDASSLQLKCWLALDSHLFNLQQGENGSEFRTLRLSRNDEVLVTEVERGRDGARYTVLGKLVARPAAVTA